MMNFALILFCLTVFTGIFWFAEMLYFKKRREAAFVAAIAALDARMAQNPESFAADEREKQVERLRTQTLTAPIWLEFPASFFPVIALVFGVRSFVVEPFKIPSPSMVPTLLVGDFIVVNKFTYGIRLPVINKKIIDGGSPKRGDVMVFRYPLDPSLDYIKRVVGVPGDKLTYQNKRLTINGVAVPLAPQPDYLHRERAAYARQFSESFDGRPHRILNDEDAPGDIPSAGPFPYRDNCLYNNGGVTCVIPPGHYFMMGDNRDNSADSRFWGFVPEANIVGRAFGIWMNWSGALNFDLSRVGGFD
jgi:signal peptidase I